MFFLAAGEDRAWRFTFSHSGPIRPPRASWSAASWRACCTVWSSSTCGEAPSRGRARCLWNDHGRERQEGKKNCFADAPPPSLDSRAPGFAHKHAPTAASHVAMLARILGEFAGTVDMYLAPRRPRGGLEATSGIYHPENDCCSVVDIRAEDSY